MRFTSRGPRNCEEIAACVEFYKHSPLGTASSLTDAEIVECWKDLLTLGVGVIDIIEHNGLAKFLKDPTKARNDPHYKHGFVYVTLGAYISPVVAKHILVRADDRVDAMLYFLERYQEYRLDASRPRPIPQIEKNGRITSDRLIMYGCSIYHTDIMTPSIRSVQYWMHKNSFLRRLYASMKQFALGFKHDAIIHTMAGEHLLEGYEKAGLHVARKYSDNAVKPDGQKKYDVCAVRDEHVANRLGVGEVLKAPGPLVVTNYTPLFLDDSVEPQAGLKRSRQYVCALRLNGYTNEHVARIIYKRERARALKKVGELKTKQSMGHLNDQEKVQLEEAIKLLDKGLAARVKNMLAQASISLQEAKVLEPPFEQDGLMAELKNDERLAHEIRKFIFPVYPWPDDLPSRS